MSGASLSDFVTLILVGGVLVASAFLGEGTFLRRALAVLAVMLCTTVLVCGLLRAVPGDAVENILGEQAPRESRVALARELGFVDAAGNPRGAVAQIGGFVRGAGSALVLAVTPASWEPALSTWLPPEPRSFRTREPVRRVVLARLPATALLGGAAILIAIVLGLGLGAVAAWQRGKWLGSVAEGIVLVGAAVPRFWLAPLLILVFSLRLRVLPPSGSDEGLRSLVLPALSLGTALAALLARMMRGSLLDVLTAPHVRTARAKGLHEAAVVTRHGLRLALAPVVTVLGLQVGGVLAGAVVTEKIFAWPGMGLLLLESVRRLDVPVMQGVVLVTALTTALATLAAEAVVRILDPRLRRMS